MRFVSAFIAIGLSISEITWAAAQHDHYSHDATAVTIPETRKLVK